MNDGSYLEKVSEARRPVVALKPFLNQSRHPPPNLYDSLMGRSLKQTNENLKGSEFYDKELSCLQQLSLQFPKMSLTVSKYVLKSGIS